MAFVPTTEQKQQILSHIASKAVATHIKELALLCGFPGTKEGGKEIRKYLHAFRELGHPFETSEGLKILMFDKDNQGVWSFTQVGGAPAPLASCKTIKRLVDVPAFVNRLTQSGYCFECQGVILASTTAHDPGHVVKGVVTYPGLGGWTLANMELDSKFPLVPWFHSERFSNVRDARTDFEEKAVRILYPNLSPDLQAAAPQCVVDAQTTAVRGICETSLPLRPVHCVGGVHDSLDVMETDAPTVTVKVETKERHRVTGTICWFFELCVSQWGLLKTLLLIGLLCGLFWHRHIKPFVNGAILNLRVMCSDCQFIVTGWLAYVCCWEKVLQWLYIVCTDARETVEFYYSSLFVPVHFVCGVKPMPYAMSWSGGSPTEPVCEFVAGDPWFELLFPAVLEKPRLCVAVVAVIIYCLSFLYPVRSDKEKSVCETEAPILEREKTVLKFGRRCLDTSQTVQNGKLQEILEKYGQPDGTRLGTRVAVPVPDSYGCVTESQIMGTPPQLMEQPIAPASLSILVVKDPCTGEIFPNGMVDCTKAVINGEVKMVGVFTGHQLEQMKAYGEYRLVHVSAFVKGLLDPETFRKHKWRKYDESLACINPVWGVSVEHEGECYSWETRDYFFEGNCCIDPYTGRDVALYYFPEWPIGSKPCPIEDWVDEVPIGPITVYGCAKNIDSGLLELRVASGCADTDYRFLMPGPFPENCELIPEFHLGLLAHTVNTGGGCSGSPCFQYGSGSRIKRYAVHALAANAKNPTRNFAVSGPTVVDLLKDFGFRKIAPVAKMDLSAPVVTESPPARKRQRKAQWRARRDGMQADKYANAPTEKGSADFNRNELARAAAAGRGEPSYRKQPFQPQGPARGQGDRPQRQSLGAGMAEYQPRGRDGAWASMDDDYDEEDILPRGSIGAKEVYEPTHGRRYMRRQGDHENPGFFQTTCRMPTIPEIEPELTELAPQKKKKISLSSMSAYSRKLMEIPLPQHLIPEISQD